MSPDPIDQACEHEQRATEICVALQRHKSQPEQYMNPDGTWPVPDCLDCGDEIEPGRLALGKVKCFACQDRMEKLGKRGLR